MSYQPYPTGGSYQPYPAGGGQMAQRPPQPQSVRWAVWCMYGGAALSAISAILVLALSSRIKNALHTALINANNNLIKQGKTPLTASQIHSTENAFIVIVVVILLISIALWVWMAWANGKGKNWARITGTVLFALNTILLFLGISRAGASTLVSGLGWLLGLGAIILLWRRESSAYFTPGPRV